MTINKLIQTGINPSGMVLTDDGKFLYIANNNNYGLTAQDSITVVDLLSLKVIDTIRDKSFNQPYALTINKKTSLLYVMNSNSSVISVVDTLKNKVIELINGFDGPSGMVISLCGKYSYVNNYGGPDGKQSGNGNTISVVELRKHKIIKSITVGLAPANLAISNNGKQLYVINYETGNPNTGTLSIINTQNNTVIKTIYGFFGPFTIAVSPASSSTNFAYVTNFGSNNFNPIGNSVSVVDLDKYKIIKTIVLGIQPAGVVFSPNGEKAYVTNYNTLYQDPVNYTGLTAGCGIVNIIHTSNHLLSSDNIKVELSPTNIIISPNGKHLYVSNYTSNVVNEIKL
jgi:YVTN family beta-propeller protein